ncbi:MAG: winged helix-turn-helix transcriptional regulator [Paracoccaceae bacterium]
MKLGLIERNPGYGHPLRPEFRLTPKGLEAAALAYKIRHVSGDRDQSVLRKSWTLPVLTSLHRSCHFNDIKRNLRTISDRALSQSLKSMESLDWVSRRVDQTARPPRALYLAVNRGEAISQLTGAKIRFDPH